MLQPVAVGNKSLADYTHLAGRPLIEEIRELAEGLAGPEGAPPVRHRVRGRRGGDPLHAHPADERRRHRGGVAGDAGPRGVLQRDQAPPQRAPGEPRLASATRSGRSSSATTSCNATEISGGWDVIIVHDPQPAGVRQHVPEKAQPLGLALPHRPVHAQPGRDRAPRAARARLRRVASSTCSDYVPAGPGRRLAPACDICPPAIDPLSPKNMALSPEDAAFVCDQFGIDVDRPLHVPGLALRPVEGPDRA